MPAQEGVGLRVGSCVNPLLSLLHTVLLLSASEAGLSLMDCVLLTRSGLISFRIELGCVAAGGGCKSRERLRKARGQIFFFWGESPFIAKD